jgi:hypothetical protein
MNPSPVPVSQLETWAKRWAARPGCPDVFAEIRAAIDAKTLPDKVSDPRESPLVWYVAVATGQERALFHYIDTTCDFLVDGVDILNCARAPGPDARWDPAAVTPALIDWCLTRYELDDGEEPDTDTLFSLIVLHAGDAATLPLAQHLYRKCRDLYPLCEFRSTPWRDYKRTQAELAGMAKTGYVPGAAWVLGVLPRDEWPPICAPDGEFWARAMLEMPRVSWSKVHPTPLELAPHALPFWLSDRVRCERAVRAALLSQHARLPPVLCDLVEQFLPLEIHAWWEARPHSRRTVRLGRVDRRARPHHACGVNDMEGSDDSGSCSDSDACRVDENAQE